MMNTEFKGKIWTVSMKTLLAYTLFSVWTSLSLSFLLDVSTFKSVISFYPCHADSYIDQSRPRYQYRYQYRWCRHRLQWHNSGVDTGDGVGVDMQSSLSVASSSKISPCCATLIHPSTGCEVVLVGCLHGAPSSAAIVRDVLSTDYGNAGIWETAENPSLSLENGENLNPESRVKKKTVTVLELCASRYAELARRVNIDAQQQNNNGVLSLMDTSDFSVPSFSWRGYFDMVVRTTQARGLSSGVAAAVLQLSSAVQTATSGFVPGLEFREAIAQVRRGSSSSSPLSLSDLVLADREVGETLSRLGRSLPLFWTDDTVNVNSDGMRSELTARVDRWCTVHRDVCVALSGDRRLPAKARVDILRALGSIRRDLVRSLIAPMLSVGFFSLMSWILWSDDAGFGGFVENGTGDALVDLVCGLFSLAFVYLVIGLPVFKVIISERDVQLCNGIEAACRIAGAEGRVVAVLGLLHVNGISSKLLESSTNTFQEQ